MQNTSKTSSLSTLETGLHNSMFERMPDSPIEMQHVVPFIGPLHVSLTGRENPVLIFTPFFKKLYKAMFGEKSILAVHPQNFIGNRTGIWWLDTGERLPS